MKKLIPLLCVLLIGCSTVKQNIKDKFNPPPKIEKYANFNMKAVTADTSKVTAFADVQNTEVAFFYYMCKRRDGTVKKYEDGEVDNKIVDGRAVASFTSDCKHKLGISLHAVKNYGERNARVDKMFWLVPIYKHLGQ